MAHRNETGFVIWGVSLISWRKIQLKIMIFNLYNQNSANHNIPQMINYVLKTIKSLFKYRVCIRMSILSTLLWLNIKNHSKKSKKFTAHVAGCLMSELSCSGVPSLNCMKIDGCHRHIINIICLWMDAHTSVDTNLGWRKKWACKANN